ncbi:MAG: RNA-binding S4 domain-containing protein [Andreesenia angusta]|nr:RNA-binding S4 domain-containing protein [Andreesenia angusta]
MKKIQIKDEYIKLDQFLKYVGITGTGGESKNIIKDEYVLVNNEIVTQRGKKLKSGDIISIVNGDEKYIIE